MTIPIWCNRIIKLGFYLLFILVPLILTPWNYELFEFNKMIVTYMLTAIITGAWVTKMIAEREFRIAKTPLDIPIALFVLSQLVSALFSIDPHISWFGYYSRFNGGLWSILSYTLLYYAFVTNVKEIDKYMRILLGVGVVVAAYGVLERMGIDKHLWVQDVQTRVFSSLGQPNWLAAYLVALIPISLGLAIKTKQAKLKVSQFVWFSVAILFFVTLLFTRSRSGYAGFALTSVIFWAFHIKRMLKTFLLFHAALLLIVFVNGTSVDKLDSWITFRGWQDRLTNKQSQAPPPTIQSGTALETGGTESTKIRRYVWQGAINAWKGSTKNIFIGTGTETFAFAFYQYRPQEHNLTSEWDFLYNKAHNEYLNYLATTGLFGLGSYLLIIGAFIVWFLRFSNKKSKIQNLPLFAGWTSILLTNFFGFSVVLVQLLFFLLPAWILVGSGYPKAFRVKRLALPKWEIVIPPIITVFVLTLVAVYWRADTHYALGFRLARAGQYGQSQAAISRAISLVPSEPLYHDELSSTLASLSVAAAQELEATIAAELAQRSLSESDRAIQTSPKNANFWKTRTKVYYSLTSLDPELAKAAIEALLKAQELSPNDPKISYNLAILYGRDADYDRALENLNRARQLKPNYRDAYFGLYVFYTELKKPTEAKAILQEYLDTVDATDKDFLERVAK